MKRKQPVKSNPNWAREAVNSMTPEEVRFWCQRLGVPVPDPRSPIERLVDEAVKSPKTKRRRK